MRCRRLARLRREVARVERGHARQLLCGEFGSVGRRRELHELILAVDVRQRRCDARLGEDELQRRLPDGAVAALGQELQRLELA